MNENDDWTDEMEAEYQRKLQELRDSLPPMPDFRPATFRLRDEIRKQWFASLTPAEKWRHNAAQPPIIGDWRASNE